MANALPKQSISSNLKCKLKKDFYNYLFLLQNQAIWKSYSIALVWRIEVWRWFLKFDGKKKKVPHLFGEHKFDHQKTWQIGKTYVGLILCVSIFVILYFVVFDLFRVIFGRKRAEASARIDSMNKEV